MVGWGWLLAPRTGALLLSPPFQRTLARRQASPAPAAATPAATRPHLEGPADFIPTLAAGSAVKSQQRMNAGRARGPPVPAVPTLRSCSSPQPTQTQWPMP